LLYVKNILFLMGVITLSILINKQWWRVNDWFEIYKVFKYFLVFILFKELCPPKINTVIIDVLFVCLLIFNFLHYHNIFDFNQIVMPLYCGEDSRNLLFFGLYTDGSGLPGPKRMIGTLENPNENAILFLIFMLFYLPKEKWKIKDVSFFVLCLVAFLACQSRTALVAFFILITVHFVINKIKWQKVVVHSGLILLVMTVFFYNHVFIDFFHSRFTESVTSPIDSTTILVTTPIDSVSISIPVPINVVKPPVKEYSTTLLDGTAFKSNSWTYRLKLWKGFLSQFLDRPIIGHAPQKNYDRWLYFDNEYILFLWRYGLLGFVAYIGFYLIPMRKVLKTIRSSELSKNTLLLILIFATCGLTNVPLSHTTLSLLFFSLLGVFYAQKHNYQNEKLTNSYVSSSVLETDNLKPNGNNK